MGRPRKLKPDEKAEAWLADIKAWQSLLNSADPDQVRDLLNEMVDKVEKTRALMMKLPSDFLDAFRSELRKLSTQPAEG
jgi:hypothetical protein